jgi:hypothetical protein
MFNIAEQLVDVLAGNQEPALLRLVQLSGLSRCFHLCFLLASNVAASANPSHSADKAQVFPMNVNSHLSFRDRAGT